MRRAPGEFTPRRWRIRLRRAGQPRNRAARSLTLSLRVFPSPFRVLLLPLTAVELRDVHFLHCAWVETARVDTETVGMRTRHIERLDAADRAEQVLGRAGVKGIACERFAAGKQPKAVRGNDEV